jgi:two-component system chemotaxis response regulator CheB
MIRVLVVDDSALMRRLLARSLEQEGDIQVVGSAADAYQARDLLVQLKPDVITLDVEMPKMNGLELLKRYMPVLPTPTIMVSAVTGQGSELAAQCLSAGAVDVCTKPEGSVGEHGFDGLRDRIRTAAKAKLQRTRAQGPTRTAESMRAHPETLVVVGSSTGGVQALDLFLRQWPKMAPPLVLAQHMPTGFTAGLARSLAERTGLDVKEASPGEHLRPGLVRIAPANDHHTVVVRREGQYALEMVGGEKVCHQRPAVDVLFDSAAKVAGRHGVGVLLTGMGRDGAAGLLAMRQAGAYTIGQDEASSVVYGMPRAAKELGAVDLQLGLDHIVPHLLARLAAEAGPRGDHQENRSKAS